MDGLRVLVGKLKQLDEYGYRALSAKPGGTGIRQFSLGTGPEGVGRAGASVYHVVQIKLKSMNKGKLCQFEFATAEVPKPIS
jgi:hypothetical protein